jgi:hypothetical protein
MGFNDQPTKQQNLTQGMLGFLRAYLGWLDGCLKVIKYRNIFLSFLSQYCVQKYLVCISPYCLYSKIWSLSNYGLPDFEDEIQHYFKKP